MEDASSVCASTIMGKEPVTAAHGVDTSTVSHKPNPQAGSPGKIQPPVAPKPKFKPQDLPGAKVQ